MQEEKLRTLIQQLNSPNPVTSISHEWEVIILSALSKVSEIEYEQEFENRSPDIFCKLPSGTCFLADITTVSDRDAHKKNPASYFFRKVYDFLDERGVSSKGIDIRIGKVSVEKSGDQKVKLALPHKGNILKFIEKELSSFANKISSSGSESHKVLIDDGAIRIQITYTPNSNFSGGGYPSYTSLYSPTRNLIFNRLKKKAKQLRDSGFSGITGIFICDGGCSSLNNRVTSPSEISQDEVIYKFFENNRRVSFILLLTPQEKRSDFGMVMENKLKLKAFQNPNADYPITDELVKTLGSMGQKMPKVESMPINALRTLEENPNIGLSHHGGYRMEGDTIKISSRTLVELLSGNLNVDKFLADHNHFGSVDKSSQMPNFFRSKILDGKMIKKIELEKSNNKDDDWIVITFGESDAALSPYR